MARGSKVKKKPRPPRPSKTHCQKQHFNERCRQRLGFIPTRSQLDWMKEQIQKRKATFFDRQSDRITRWLVTLQNISCLVVYDNKRHNLVTIWPFDLDLDKCNNIQIVRRDGGVITPVNLENIEINPVKPDTSKALDIPPFSLTDDELMASFRRRREKKNSKESR